MVKGIKVSFNSPVVLGFSLICLIVTALGIITNGYTNNLLFSVYRASLSDPLTYLRFVGHVFGHADFAHFTGNIMLLLLIGSLLEEKYGWQKLLMVMLATAIVTGLVNFMFFPNIQLLGSSGIVFAFILLSSLTSIKTGTIPLTFILVVILYIGGEVYNSIFTRDTVSQLTHIVGGVVGGFFGFKLNK